MKPGYGQQSVSVTAGTQNFTLTLTKTFANPQLDPLVCTYPVTILPLPTLTCAVNVIEASCQTQDAINAKFATWLGTVSSSNGTLTRNPTTPTAPNACGGATTVTWTVTGDCGTKTCSASFTVTAAPAVVVNCASNSTEASCQTQDAINTKYAAWLATFSATGGCNRQSSNNSTGAPSACGGSKTVTWTVTSSCEATKTCSASFTVTAAPAVVVTCASNTTEASCQTQDAINAKYTAWLATFSATGGCNRQSSNNSTGAPEA
jgi:hypothetical protein